MGTISDKLMRVINTKEDIRRALISKGYDVPTSIPFKEYAKMISDLPCKVDDFPKLPGDVTRWHFGGLTNEMMAAMDDPRIEDADHKGRFLSFKNFAWGGMSGVGGYVDNWNSSADWNIDSYWGNSHTDHKLQFITAGVVAQARSNNIYNAENVYKNILNVNGLTEAVNKGAVGGLIISAVDPITSKVIKLFSFKTDGIIQISFDDVLQDYYVVYFVYGNITKDIDITIEQLPLYPGFILGDGVDDFAVTEKELNFEDTYTVYTAFIPFQNNPTRNMILCGADSKKTFSMQYSSLVYVSFIAGNNYYINADFVNGLNLFACKRNGNNICIKNLLTNKVVTGTCGDWVENAGLYYLWKNATYASFAKAAIAGQIIDNGHFTTDEEDENILNWHKKQYPWLFPDQAWTVTGKTNEDEDRATIANITGNGNDLVLSNFGFAEGSGYGLYAQNYISYAITNRAVYTKTNSSIHVTKSITAGVNFTESARDVTIPSYRIKVTGIQSGQEMIYRGRNNTFLTNIPSDGIYVLPAVENGSNLGFQFVSYTGDCDITIEQIPEYEGYLVTDGVDDKVQSSSFTMNEDWTIVGDWELLSNVQINCGIVKAQNVYLYNTANGLLISINNPRSLQSFGTKSLHAICSDGRLYDRNWVEYEYTVDQNFEIVESSLNIGFNLNNYTQIAFKNLGIYNNQILSKDDCIKAYNYLQTLKSK